jgi:Ni2+-binding GTPase involved in maturation of urease and hydrogenase
MPKARYIMVGGFLGAGKTTAILRMAELLRARGERIGLITNDQSFGLVDTAMLNAHDFPVQEITGGCFCCKFNSLVDASEKLTQNAAPDTFIAEPVGSCTDLKATVDYPLRRIYGSAYAVAPLSVLVDPIRAMRILGLQPGKSFSEKVVYIYNKQLEEAEVIVVNKIDLLSPEQRSALRDALASRFPHARIELISARTNEGVETWVDHVAAVADVRTSGAMDVDYDTYADGEALLGWLNATLKVASADDRPFDGDALLLDLARAVQSKLAARAEIAHLKMTLTPEDDGGGDIAVANLVRSDGAPELSHRLVEPLESGELILNLRAEADPELLRSVALEAIHSAGGARGLTVEVEHLERFRPGKPTPTHRMAAV